MNGLISMSNLKKRILVIGDIMLDHYLHGECNRISPEAPVPIFEKKNESWLLGGAGNVSNNLSSFGIEVLLCGFVGHDPNGLKLKKLLAQKNIQDYIISSPWRRTTVKTRVVASNQQLIRIDDEEKSPLTDDEEEMLFDKIQGISLTCNCIILSDYNKGVITKNLVQKIVKLAQASGIKILVDPKTASFSKYEWVNYIKPNRKEASFATGIEIIGRESLTEACKIIKKQSNCDAVIITLSENGVAHYDGNELVVIPTRAQAVFDVTGAGDTFLAGLAYSFVDGKNLHDACEFANYASSLVVAKHGCATVSIHEINERRATISENQIIKNTP